MISHQPQAPLSRCAFTSCCSWRKRSRGCDCGRRPALAEVGREGQGRGGRGQVVDGAGLGEKVQPELGLLHEA